MKVNLYAADGSKKGSKDVSDAIFGAKINADLMHRAIVMRLANRRNPIAHTKTRGEVAYSTKKLFRQKGTGNARRGARSTNILRGGGVTHGPRNTAHFEKSMPKKERRAALFASLSSQVKDEKVSVLQNLKLETPKTKTMVSLLGKLPEGKKHLFVLGAKDENFEKSCNNIPGVSTILASYLNPYDVLLADQVIFLEDSLEVVEQTFLSKSN